MNMMEFSTLELSLKDMKYLDAFILLTMDHNFHARVAMIWLEQLSQKYPGSRLAVHYEANRRCSYADTFE